MKRILSSALILVGGVVFATTADAAPAAKKKAPPKKVEVKKAAPKSTFVPTKLKVKQRKPPTYWGDGRRVLDAALAGPWATKFAMRRGYVTKLIKRACEKHKGVCGALGAAQKALNAAFGRCGGLWPNARMALVAIAKATARGSAVKLAPDMGKALGALAGACAAAKSGGVAALKPIRKLLKTAFLGLKKKKATGFIKTAKHARKWLKKGNVWGKPGARPAAHPAAAAAGKK